MADRFMGEIRMFAGPRLPSGWAYCNGQVLKIADYEALYSLIGVAYGGDGRTTFALPDLRGRVPMHMGTGPGLSQRILGQHGGSVGVKLTTAQIPEHTHTMIASEAEATLTLPKASIFAAVPTGSVFYGTQGNTLVLADETVSSEGGNAAHENRMPSLGMNFIIALTGVYPNLK